jgi:hypothetical protein
MFSSCSIRLPTSGWTPVDGDVDTWRNGAGDVLSLHYFPLPPDLPAPLSEMDTIRIAYRRLLGKRSAIIELEPDQIGGCGALRGIFKIVQQPSTMMYMAVLMVPFRDHNFMVKVTCPDTGVTDLRDAEVATRLGVERTNNWAADPYDASYSNPVLRNRSDNAEWDALFPDHPLTRARRQMQHTLLRAELPEAVRDLAPFEGPLPSGARYHVTFSEV